MIWVRTREEWRGKVKIMEWPFVNVLHMLKFIQLCDNSGTKWEIVKNKNNRRRGA